MNKVEFDYGCFGLVRRVRRDGQVVHKLKCPDCGKWADLDDDQYHGRVSVDHSNEQCGYHETFDFSVRMPA